MNTEKKYFKALCLIAVAFVLFANISSLMQLNVSAKGESSYHASIRLTSNIVSPKPGDTITITLSAKTDYPLIIADTVIAYDNDYYTIVGSGTGAVKQLCDYSVKMSAVTKSVSAMYHQSYDEKMTEKYKLLFVTMQWLSSLGSDAGDTPTDVLNEYVKIYSFKLKVKSSAPKDGKGIVWMDPVFLSTENSNLRCETKLSRGGNYLKDGVIASCGQSIDLSEAKLFNESVPEKSSVSTISLNYKENKDIKNTLFPDGDGGKKYTWTSSDSSIVDSSGSSVTGLKRGSAYISAVSSDYSSRKTCIVNVEYSFLQWLIVIFLFGWIWY